MSNVHFHIFVYYYGTTTLSGSRRWREMSGLLAKHGKVTVYCADGPGEEAPRQVTVQHIPDGPSGQAGTEFAGRSQRSPFMQKLQKIAASILFWPDRQKEWAKGVVTEMVKNFGSEQRNIVISSGPIFSVHSEMCRWVRQNLGQVEWVMDFRDLWTNEIAPGLERRVPAFLTNFEKKIEQRCHDTADVVTAVGEGLRDLIRQDFGSHPVVLYNGYLEKDCVKAAIQATPKPVSLRYLGTIIPGLRSPALLFEAAAKLKLSKSQLIFEFWCNDSTRVLNEAEKYGVEELVKCHKAVPGQEARELSKTAGANLILNALIPEANQVVTGKVFELMTTQRPVITITGQDSELRKILASCGIHQCVWDLDTACHILEASLDGSLPYLEDKSRRFSRESAVDNLLRELNLTTEEY